MAKNHQKVRGKALIIRPNFGRQKDSRAGDSVRSFEKNGKAKRILLVNDHDLFRQALAIVLEQRANFDVCAQAASLAEAREVLSVMNGTVDLAVVDIDLPNGGGVELIRELQELPSVSVLALTADREQGPRTWMGEVLSTAASIDEIVGAARQLVG